MNSLVIHLRLILIYLLLLEKGTRDCTKKPVYALSNYVSLNRSSSSYQNFIVNLNTIVVPNNLSETQSKEEWKNAMKEEMKALGKKINWAKLLTGQGGGKSSWLHVGTNCKVQGKWL